VRMSPYTSYLRARSDDELVALLAARPDLASPSPSTLSSLAVRATSRASLERALAAVDAGVLQVVEAVVAMDGVTRAELPRLVGATASAEVAFVDERVGDALVRLLVFPDDDGALHAAPGVAELFGAYPAGLAPAELAGRRRGPAGDEPADEDPAALLLRAPKGARSVLDALLWGPPVGLAPSHGTPAGAAVGWLVDHGLLVAADLRHVVLPRPVALALRGGRTHSAPALPPPVAEGAPRRQPEVVAAEAAAAGDHLSRLALRLVRAWEVAPPVVLRAGGLGVRELKRTSATLEVSDAETAFVVEVAGAAGLVADDGEETPSFVPTHAADDFHLLDLPERWAVLARGWLETARTPWLVGGRDDKGGVIAALDPELQRPWAPRLRAAVLQVLADAPAGTALSAEAVVESLQWRTPRAVPPQAAVEALLAEATTVGVVGAGALTEPGRALLAGGDAARAFAAGLPPAVDEILLQGDLTGIVPGRPSTVLEELIDRAARVESRGGALTVRFTPESVRRAFDQGSTADSLLAELGRFARGGVPQPLEYLVRDAARRHGLVRVGAASAYVRADDPALLAGLADDPHLASLGLVLLAPTVVAAQVGVRELLEALRGHGLAPVAEGPDGQVLHVAPEPRRLSRRSTLAARRRAESDALIAAARESASPERLRALVPMLRRAEEAAEAAPEPASLRQPVGARWLAHAERALEGGGSVAVAPHAGASHEPAHGTTRTATRPRGDGGPTARGHASQPPGGTDDPAAALVVLREAASAKALVWVELVGSTGAPQRRLLRPVRVDGGRLRAVDPQREAELTVAVHRIASVTRADPAD
jgi:hypothetical protein